MAQGIARRCIDFGLTVHLGAEFARHDLQVTVLAGAAPAHIYEALRAPRLALGDGSCASLSSLAVLSNYHQCRAGIRAGADPITSLPSNWPSFSAAACPPRWRWAGTVDYLLKQSGGFKGEER